MTVYLLRWWRGLDVERVVGLFLLPDFPPLFKIRQVSLGTVRTTIFLYFLTVWRTACTYPGQLFLVHLSVSCSGMFGFLFGEHRFGLLVLRLALWRRLIDPGVQIQTEGRKTTVVRSFPVNSLAIHSRKAHPSGIGTFFWALGATGLSSPAKRAVTSSATSTFFCCSFWMYFTSWRMQDACGGTSQLMLQYLSEMTSYWLYATKHCK